jgi:long-chain acyl-CoA synthetase
MLRFADPTPENGDANASPDWRADWLASYPCDQPSTVPYPRTSLAVLLERAARRFPERAACTLFGKQVTYDDLNNQARRLAAALVKMGAGKGKHVGLLLPNIPEYLIALQAVWLTGATALQISPLMVAEEVGHWLKASDCHIVVTLDLLAPTVMGSLRPHGPLEHVVLTSLASRLAMWKGMLYRLERLRRNGFIVLPHDAQRHRFDELVDHNEPLEKSAEVDPFEDVAVLAPTGGTTASPKAVMLTHHNLIANAMQLRNWVGGPDGVEGVLGVLPFFHCYGLTVSLLSCWARASTLHLLPRFEARPVLDLLLRARPEVVPAVPAMLNVLNALMRDKKIDLSFVRLVISGASALPAAVRDEFLSHGAKEIVEGYGLTEAGPVTHANLEGAANRPGTIGVPLPDTEARVIDPDTGRELGVGEIGELVVHGPQVMKGYLNNPEATAAVLRNGWLHTGDVARRDAEGGYTIVDRKRDIIKTSGFLVYPAEVEEVLRNFVGVAEAAVVGDPDAERGEVVRALVVPRNGKLDLHALEGYCREHLSKHKRPRRFTVVTELPKNFLGKVLRRKLREETVTATAS